MRWMLLALVLPIAIAGLLYGGGIAFLSSLSNAVAPRGAHGSGTVAATAMQAPAPPGYGLAGPAVAVAVAVSPIKLASSPASQPEATPAPEDSSPAATEQRVFQSRKALETVDPKELLRQGALSK